MKKQKGFSLIELLIVVAIILIIAAIAIPNLLRSRMAANEASAVGSVRTITTAQVTYSSTYPATGFANTLAALGGISPCTASVATACLIDQVLAAGVKSGYNMGLSNTTGTPVVTFSVDAWPVVVGQTGQRSFCGDQSGVIRYDSTGAQPGGDCGASALPPLQ